MAGHSLGGASVIEFSTKYPAQVNILVPITPVISAETLLIAAKDDIIINPNDIKKLSQGIHNGQISTIDAAGHNFEKTQNQTDLYLAIYNFLQ